jgi:protein O-mannosyl-transferase
MLERLSEFFNNSKRNTLFLILIGYAVYLNSFGNQLFWDDFDNIINNQYVHDFDLFKFFSENLIAGAGLISNYWRPLELIIWSIEWQIWGAWAPGYHFIQTQLHIINAVLVYILIKNLAQKRWMAFVVALLFLIHPLQTEAITYVSGIADPLGALFTLISVISYIKWKKVSPPAWRRRWYLVSIATYPLALMSRETTIMVPGIIFMIEAYWQLQANPKLGLINLFKRSIVPTLPYIGFALLYILLRATVLNFQNSFNLYDSENEFTQNIHYRTFTFFRVVREYLELLIIPHDLHMERTVDIAKTLWSPDVLVGGLFAVGTLAVALWKYAKYPLLSLGIIWFWLWLFPTSNILIPINGLIYEHWLYLPMVGFFFCIVWALSRIRSTQIHMACLVVLVLFVLFLSYRTLERNAQWRDPVTLYSQTVQYAPTSFRVVNNLGMAYADSQDFGPAEYWYTKALELDGQNPVVFHNLANLYRDTGRDPQALEYYKKALDLNPDFIYSYNATAGLLINKKQHAEARLFIEKYVDRSTLKLQIYFLLSQIAFDQQDTDGVITYLEKAKDIDPTNQAVLQSLQSVKAFKQSQPSPKNGQK